MNNEISFRQILFACSLQIRQYFLENNFFMELFFLNSSLNNLFESSSIKDFLVDFAVDFLIYSLMCLNISFLVLKLLKYFLSGLILINSQLSSFSNAFCLFFSFLSL